MIHRNAIIRALLSLLFFGALTAQTPPRYTLTRDLRIDAATANLSPVTWLAVSRTGTVAVGQDQDHLVRFFDARGQSLGTFGHAGEGPGEFRSLISTMVGWIGDTLSVGDYRLARFTLLTPDRKLLRTVAGIREVKNLGDSSGHTQLVGAVALYANGSQLIQAVIPTSLDDRPAWARDPRHLDTRLALVGVSATGLFQHLASYGVYDNCGFGGSTAYALCGRPEVGIDPTAERLAWLAMSYAGADSGTYRVTMFTRTGTTIYTRQYPFIAQPIPQHIRDSIAARALAEPKMPPVAPALAPHAGPPAIYPGVESIIVASDGSAWVELRATKDGIPWVMLSPKGDVTGTMMAPANVKLLVIGPGVVWGTEKDADDLESVVRFRVVRAGAH